MKPTEKLVVLSLILILIGCEVDKKSYLSEEKESSNEISFFTPDSINIIGDFYELDKAANTILLFHQGGSNARGEYVSIIPKLRERGFNILAIDQRSGGQVYGSYNRTLANIPENSFGDGYTYCDAYNNLEGALDYVIEKGFLLKKILWGSSYSASLAIQLGNNRQDEISAVLAFSPASGGAMKACLPDPYFESMKIPLLILRPPNEMEREASQQQFELAKQFNHQTYVPQHGVHGSSMLVKERVGEDVSETWKVVFDFLDKI